MSAFEAQKLVGAIILLVIALVVIIRRDVVDLSLARENWKHRRSERQQAKVFAWPHERLQKLKN